MTVSGLGQTDPVRKQNQCAKIIRPASGQCFSADPDRIRPVYWVIVIITHMQEGQHSIQDVEEDVLHDGPRVCALSHLALGRWRFQQHVHLVRVAGQVVDQLVDVARDGVDEVPHGPEDQKGEACSAFV